MSLGLIGRKVGMMRIFTDEGDSIPVTVVDVSDNRVTQVRRPRQMVIPLFRLHSANAVLPVSIKLPLDIMLKQVSKPVLFCANSEWMLPRLRK